LNAQAGGIRSAGRIDTANPSFAQDLDNDEDVTLEVCAAWSGARQPHTRSYETAS
jgi:hypothetical protein